MDNSGSAFPTEDKHYGHGNPFGGGLTKREWFVGMALQGILASASPNFCTQDKPDGSMTSYERIAYRCYRQADAMLAASQKEGTNAQQ